MTRAVVLRRLVLHCVVLYCVVLRYAGAIFIAALFSALPTLVFATPPDVARAARLGERHFPETLERLAFGSCLNQNDGQPIWKEVQRRDPSAFLFLGDNIYVTSEAEPVQKSMPFIAGEYRRFAEGEFLSHWTRPLLAVWDDNDYGAKDGGAEYPFKEESKKLFLATFRIPSDSARAKRAGNYESITFGPPENRVEILLLDTRSFRSPLTKAHGALDEGQGPYVPGNDPQATVLGDEQWRWLEDQLTIPARVRIIASSIQVIPNEHGFETWGNFPRERDKLLSLLSGATGFTMMVSGDRHHGEMSRIKVGDSELWDITSSSLNMFRPDVPEKNSLRVGQRVLVSNFGLLSLDWKDSVVSAQIIKADGESPLQQRFHFGANATP